MKPTGVNRVELSDDRRSMVICGPNGERADARSRLPNGFTNEQVWWAVENYRFTATPGCKNKGWLKQVAGLELYFYVGTGPPTWWIPKIRIGLGSGRRFKIGWLRLMIAFEVRKSPSK